MYVTKVSFPTGNRFSLAFWGIKSTSLKQPFFVTETAVCLNEILTFFSLVLLLFYKGVFSLPGMTVLSKPDVNHNDSTI